MHLLPEETDMPAPAMTTIFFLWRSTSCKSNIEEESSSCSGLPKSSTRLMWRVMRSRLVARRRRLAGRAPSGLTMMEERSSMSDDFEGEAVPESRADDGGEGMPRA